MVVRCASAGSKEWALAIESELTSIENDWRALAWALSGTRVLFDTQPAPLPTIADLDAEVQKYADRRRHAMNNGWLGTNAPLLAPLIVALQTLSNIFIGRHIFSNTVLLLGLSLLAPMLYLRTREPDVPDRDDQAGLVRFYVNELSAATSTSKTFWMFVMGALITVIGIELKAPLQWDQWESVLPLLLLPVLILFPVACVVAKHRNNRRRLAQVEALIGTIPD